MQEPSTASAQ
jgi:hypothetical protein